jgi:hypothetical protein
MIIPSGSAYQPEKTGLFCAVVLINDKKKKGKKSRRYFINLL